ncbi:unnamed protein product [Mytilus edulis]|uniref:SMP-30/Gluconolactonase/LRE-like region domain-containing protein n=1 Tax=Mytilus edulis TaxID=6550 RepID=A0A8S3UF01_MYTED|nr:unnamed protein product [Mytilus edulis]
MQSSKGRTAACQEMIMAVKRRRDNWALLLLEAIKETQEYVKLKMDPSASQEELERTGILVAGTNQRYHSGLTTSMKESLPCDSPFHFDVKLRQKFRLQSNQNSIIHECIITNDQLVFSDYVRNSLMINAINGNSNREIKLSGIPFKISLINDNDIAVSTYRKFIEIISINTGQVKKKIVASGRTGSISYQNNLMFADIGHQKIEVMNLTGEVIRSFIRPLKSTVLCLSSDTDSLFFSDALNNTVYCCDLNGSDRWKFTAEMMKSPTGVTTDGNGYVYVICYISNNVVVVSPDGKHHKELLTAKDGLRNPTGIYYDKPNDCLLVYNKRLCDVFLFSVKHLVKI